MKKVFVDGSAGTTGLRIVERLDARQDVERICLPEALRKDPAARRDAIARADVAFLCLPDDAAREAVAQAEGTDTVIIDTSTAHRTLDDWTYGFAEIGGLRDAIRTSSRIANPGCHASGFIALIRPLTEAGLLAKDAPLSCFSLTGYSGGGKSMIAQYESPERDSLLDAPRQYALGQQHKHLKEMTVLCSLTRAPVFCPIVADYYSGMEVTVPVFADMLRGSAEDVKEAYRAAYTGKLVHFNETPDEGGFLSANAYAGFDDMEISVTGSEERILLTARFDNLGKGASGAAIQNMNIRLGLEETTGLSLSERMN
jgi:N-acetyl-gamma-glutamyl-phosphate reductase